MGNKLQRKRKSRSLAGKQHEACSVWLDASALKKHKLQNLIGKPLLRILSQPSSYNSASKVSLGCTKQTTISTFFRTQQAEDTSQSLCPVNTSSAADASIPHFPVGQENALPASVVPSIDTEKCSQQHIETPQCCLPWHCPPAQTRDDTHTYHLTKGEDTLAEEAYPFSLDVTQPWEEKRILDHPLFSEPPLRERNSDWKRKKLILSSSPNSPKLETLSSKRAKSQRRYGFSDSENINPQLEKKVTHRRNLWESFRETASGFSLKSSHPTCTLDHWTENSQARVGSPLFTQDSEGYKVISHHFPHVAGKLPLQNQLLQGKSSAAVATPPHKGCSGACYSVEQRPHASPGTTLSVLADISQKSCCDLLFTEGSEGNKVINS